MQKQQLLGANASCRPDFSKYLTTYILICTFYNHKNQFIQVLKKAAKQSAYFTP